ncbi:MAG TPA: EamA family transporter, partial [Erythrobacter sp.]|nr:EamA family transporter [Erythrobacter sp.]
MSKGLPLSALGIMLFCNVAWAMNVVVSKIAVSTLGLPPLFYTVLRSATVLIVLFPLLRQIPARLPLVLGIGFAISGGSFSLQFMGLQSATPSALGIVSLAGAPMTVLFAVVFLGEEVRW